MPGRGARGSDDVRSVCILLHGWEGSRWQGLSHVLYDDLKVLLILLDGWEGARGSDDVSRVRILPAGKEGSTGVRMARIVARALG